MAEKDSPGFYLNRRIGVTGRVGGRDGQSRDKVWVEEREGGAAFLEGKNSVGDLVDGEVFAYGAPGSLPHEGAFRGVELGQEGAIALRGPKGGPVGNRLIEPPCGRIYLRGGRGQSEGGHALAVFYQQGERRKAGFDGQYRNWGRNKAIGDPSLNASPEDVESVLHFHKGCEQVCAV